MSFYSLKKKFMLCIAIIISSVSFYTTAFANTNQTKPTSIQEKLAELESASGGKLGVVAINTANNTRLEYRAEERFPFQSTFKVLVVSAILKESMTDSHLLQKKIMINENDLVFWSPITKTHITDGMTVFELSAAAMMYSDNAATNLLVKELGGVNAVNAYARSIGDDTFRLDGWEPKLNSNPADMRDTSTPAAMGKDFQKLVLGNLLAAPQREQLIAWLKGNTTGDNRIRAGVPKGWIVGDKTGGGMDYGVTNDVGIVWPPHCPPIIIAVYLVQNKKDAPRHEEVVASATRLLLSEFDKAGQCVKLAPH